MGNSLKSPLFDHIMGEKAYAGQSGEVTDLYSISPSTSEVFYIYMVRVETDNRAIVLHEDEIQPYVS